MARIIALDQDRGSTCRIVGTYGYMSPEYAMHGQFSEKSDVFSFGVILLEIISAKRNAQKASYVEWENDKGGVVRHDPDARKNMLGNVFVKGFEIGDEGAALESLQFSLTAIEVATKKFSNENKIGKGGFGEVYKELEKENKDFLEAYSRSKERTSQTEKTQSIPNTVSDSSHQRV
ncbi:hypothetical protein Lal_00011618 [Lupinus albus]|nr:hypothetical protein Lal_00011618 [Lupinus albus]